MRKVKVPLKTYNSDLNRWEVIFVNAYFHQWGLELDGDIGSNITVGIVELDSGEIKTMYPNDITFINN